MDNGTAPQTISVPRVDFLPIGQGLYDWAVGFYPTLFLWVKTSLNVLIIVSIPLSVIFFFGIIYTVERLKVIRKLEAEKFDKKNIESGFGPAAAPASGGGSHDLSVRWSRVNSHMSADRESDWKQAIIEADMMLDDILTGLGYRGESVGEKLKRVQKGDMKTLDDAWEAHKVRNRIAHEPGYQMIHHEANQAIQRYRRVFEEFYYI